MTALQTAYIEARLSGLARLDAYRDLAERFDLTEQDVREALRQADAADRRDTREAES